MSKEFTYQLLSGFDDSIVTEELWNELLENTSSATVFLTLQWHKTWWQVFGRGQLILILIKQNKQPVAIAPLFSDGGMIYFTGSGGSDYLDLIGKIGGVKIFHHLLEFAALIVPDFIGFCFYHVLENSKTGKLLQQLNTNKWICYNEGTITAPYLDIKMYPSYAAQATNKKSLVRHTAWYKKNGELKIEDLYHADDILPHLNNFFKQHINRWKHTPFPSLFLDEQQKLFYTRLTEYFSETGWLRFTRVIWEGSCIAYHFGFNYKNNFLWYKPSFDISFAKHSPGETLLQHLLFRAIEDEVAIFDFGLGDELFKKRFATGTHIVNNWGVYPLSQKNNNYVHHISYQSAS
jgi:CelD/BcsL family acetyltransferase involved in cellulose biosynthesis